MNQRNVEIVIVSDAHLGTFGAHAAELNDYLRSIRPDILVLNGDIIDIWQFRKRYFPEDHLQVIQTILEKLASGTKVYYLTGNHDDFLRRFSDFQLGNFHLRDKLLLNVGNQSVWIFHGDVFDSSVQHARWVARLGGKGYDLLIRINRFVNIVLKQLGKEPRSFSKRIKQNVKRAVRFIGDFEETAATLAMEQGFDYVVCGHIHRAVIKRISNKQKSVIYMNSGDWVESLTALEYNQGDWCLFDYHKSWTREQLKGSFESVPIPISPSK